MQGGNLRWGCAFNPTGLPSRTCTCKAQGWFPQWGAHKVFRSSIGVRPLSLPHPGPGRPRRLRRAAETAVTLDVLILPQLAAYVSADHDPRHVHCGSRGLGLQHANRIPIHRRPTESWTGLKDWFVGLGPIQQAFVATLGFITGFTVMMAMANAFG